MKKSLWLIVVLTAACFAYSQKPKKPRIGVVLSGGGAKGLAHIGVLEVIDDIGLKVDYVTGTSMGGIIGALYAVGYSADSIHKIATSEKWDVLLSNQIPLESLTPDERLEYEKYILEFFLEKRKIKLPTGLIDGQLMGLELAHLTNPVCDKKNFKDFPIPFKCMGTNIGTGKLVVLDSGNIVEAMRASMAIPSIFTPVWYNNMLLVDGGVVHNFPVSDAIAMGATIVIGINVSTGILPAEQLNSIPSILLQTVFIAENNDFQKQKGLVDYLVEPSLDKYGASDFDMVDSIIARGRKAGEQFRPMFQALKDSLNRIYSGEYTRTIKPIKAKHYYFTDIEVTGLKRHTAAFVKGRLNLELNKCYTSKELNDAMTDLYGTRYFKRLSYELVSDPDTTHNKLLVHVSEESNYAAKFAINYNSLFQSSLILNLTARHLLMKDSKLLLTFNLGDNFRAKVSYGKYFGDRQTSHISIIGNMDQYDVPTLFSDLSKTQVSDLNKMNVFTAQLNFQRQYWKRWVINTGVGTEYYNFRNKIGENYDLNAIKTYCNSVYLNTKYTTQNKIYYPTKGLRISASGSYVFNYRYSFKDLNGSDVPIDNLVAGGLHTLVNKEFQQASLSISYLAPISKRTVVTQLVSSGFTFNTRINFTHYYRLGGLRENFWHNIPFIGFREFGTKGQVLTMNNVVAYQLGVQHELFRNFYCIPRINAASVATEIKSLRLEEDDPSSFLVGYGATLAYNSFLGPIEFSVMHSNQFQNLQFYLNLGYNFYNN